MAEILWTKVHPEMGTESLPWPARKSLQAAGWDCCAAIDAPIELWPGRLVVVPLGFALALPEGFEAQIRPRSGLATRGLTMPNSPGTIDADYRGEVKAILYWLPVVRTSSSILEALAEDAASGPLIINPGDRIAQMVFCRLADATVREVDNLSARATERGVGGFGSTGTKAQ